MKTFCTNVIVALSIIHYYAGNSLAERNESDVTTTNTTTFKSGSESPTTDTFIKTTAGDVTTTNITIFKSESESPTTDTFIGNSTETTASDITTTNITTFKTESESFTTNTFIETTEISDVTTTNVTSCKSESESIANDIFVETTESNVVTTCKLTKTRKTRQPRTTQSKINVSKTRRTKTTIIVTEPTTTTIHPEEFRQIYPTVMSIENVVKQAIKTFSVRQTMVKFQENLDELMNLVDKLTLTDVYLTPNFVEELETGNLLGNPIAFMPIYQDKDVSISVFVMQKYSKIPLHDHPLMHGVFKVLYGKVQMESYTIADTRHIRSNDVDSGNYAPNEYYYLSKSELFYETMGTHAIRHPKEILSVNESCRLLTPFENNLHLVKSHNGTSAFFDILAPPYFTETGNVKRKCTFFNVIETKIKDKPMLSLSVYPAPYYTNDIEYRGPPINGSTLRDEL